MHFANIVCSCDFYFNKRKGLFLSKLVKGHFQTFKNLSNIPVIYHPIADTILMLLNCSINRPSIALTTHKRTHKRTRHSNGKNMCIKGFPFFFCLEFSIAYKFACIHTTVHRKTNYYCKPSFSYSFGSGVFYCGDSCTILHNQSSD